MLIFFRQTNHLWNNVQRYGTERQSTDENTIRHLCFECSMIKSTNTHWEYLTICACRQQQVLCKRTLMLIYKYVVSLVVVLIHTWTNTSLPVAYVNSWYNSLRSTTYSAEPDSYVCVSKIKKIYQLIYLQAVTIKKFHTPLVRK